MIPGAFLYLRIKKKDLEVKRDVKLSNMFKETAEILSSYINAGYSVENAFLITYKESERMFGREAEITKGYRAIVDGIRINKPVESLIEHFAETSGLQEIRSLAEVLSIAKRTGGDIREIIDRTVGVIREKAELREEIKNMTAAKRYEQKIMSLMPFPLIIYIDFTQPEYLNVMYETLGGRIIMTLCMVLFAAAYYISSKLTNIEL